MRLLLWLAQVWFAASFYSAGIIVETESLKLADGIADSLRSDNSPCLHPSIEATVRRRYVSSIFKGLSIETNQANQHIIGQLSSCLRSLPGVLETWISRPYQLASASTSTLDALDGSVLHELTGVDVLHELNITGHGTTIAVIDEGIDYLHPAFGGGIGKSFTVRYGQDLVGDAFKPGLHPDPDPDPFSECSFHGTHVAGIAAGKQDAVGFVGVAPDSRIDAFRISSCDREGPIRADVVVDALLAAHTRKVDVINLSLDARTGPYPEDVISVILERIVQEDRIVCVVAAGNHGALGAFSSTAPSSASGVVSVGSVNAKRVPRSQPRARYSVDGEGEQWTDFPWLPATPGRFPETIPLRALSLNVSVEDDACQPLQADNTQSLARSIGLVRRGGCLFAPKMEHIIAQGAEYALIYDNTTNASSLFEFDNFVEGIKGAGSLSAETGQRFVEMLAAGKQISVHMDSNFTLHPYIELQSNPAPHGLTSGGGSWGPNGQLALKPSVLAPGWGIWSTVPRSWGGYATFSGTSQAAPYIAGCFALLRQVYPRLSAAVLVRRLITSATPLPFSDGTNRTYNMLASVWQQGSGRVNALAAVRLQTDLSVSSIAFNDTEFFHPHASFQITNVGIEAASYGISHAPAVTVPTFAASGHGSVTRWSREGGNEAMASPEFLDGLLPQTAHIAISPHRLVIQPGQTATVHITAGIRELARHEHVCPLYSGFIVITRNDEEQTSVTYGGVACRMKDIVVLPRSWNRTYLSASTFRDVEYTTQDFEPAAPHNMFEIPDPQSSPPDLDSTVMYPTVVLELAMFSPDVNVTLQSAGDKQCPRGQCQIVSYPAYENTGRPGGYSRATTSHFLWRGQMQNGSWAFQGSYRLEICAARAWDEGRDCVTTTEFSIAYF